MGRFKDCINALFHRGNDLDSSGSESSITMADDAHKEKSQQPIRRPSYQQPSQKKKAYAMFNAPNALPYRNYETFSNQTRQLISTTGALVYKTSLSEDALVPLEDEGIGRLKAFYEAWFAKNGALSKDKISGIFALSFVSANTITETIYCGNAETCRQTSKHYIQCLYSGDGVRRACTIDHRNVGCMGLEIWIKASLPLGRPWVQSMYIPPEIRLNKLCLLAAPMPDYAIYVNTSNSLAELPMLTAKKDGPVFELDSDVYVYACRLLPCASVCHTVKSAAKCAKEPPMFEPPRLRRAATVTNAPGSVAQHSRRQCTSSSNKHAKKPRHQSSPPPPKPSKERSVFVHVLSSFCKNGSTTNGGARLMLPGSIQLNGGDGIHLQEVEPGAEITLKNTGFDRAQFVLIDMPGYQDDSDAHSI
ncbi:hypothetical protein LPJ64_004772 [Coemansia asiatica]|uniref:Uncharacterized protein n=1 Tax=Coemansia asiatica TaxID=1052880 RepID=A0A9W8CI93_9FUNG|nr:hypothetical protein LPJ64_004772 [Coemansia asiatica]KAJ2878049.1 hypothetical protein FB639_003527 [Coemansia asiatica]